VREVHATAGSSQKIRWRRPTWSVAVLLVLFCASLAVLDAERANPGVDDG
jgi:hypothetical protein